MKEHHVKGVAASILPKKAPNNTGRLVAEALEERPVTKGNLQKDDCELYVETGGSIEQTSEET